MAWDFTDTSFRPSIVLKAAHFKITSMEFLTGTSISSKQQLLAAGDESGTLHIFEMPKSLVKPAHKEAIIMSAFLDREREVGQINLFQMPFFLLYVFLCFWSVLKNMSRHRIADGDTACCLLRVVQNARPQCPSQYHSILNDIMSA